MSNVIPLQGSGAMTPTQARYFFECDAAIAAALASAKSAGVPQGLLVAILHGHAHAATHQMLYPDA